MAQLRKLSATFVKNVRSPGTWIDRNQHGLALEARQTKIRGLSKTWIQHLEIDGEVTTLRLGTYPKVTLDEARRRAKKNSKAVEEDRHPTTRNQPTFKEAAERVIELHSYSWRPGGGTLIGPIRTVVRHQPAVHHSQVSQVLRTIEASNAYWATKAAFRFMTYTAARNGMVRGARWEEIDLASATWTVAGERVKRGRTFKVPLSQAALAVLEQAWQYTGGVGLVFPSPTGRPLSASTLSKLCRLTGTTSPN